MGSTRKACGTCLALALLAAPTTSGRAQKSSTPRSTRPLALIGAITLPNVQGRLDHFALGPGGRIFVSAYGNNTLEVLSLGAQTVVHTISVPRPQGVVFAPQVNELFVGSDDGRLYVYNASSFQPIKPIDFGEDVDALRYDAATERVYVAYGDGEAGAIGVVDAATNSRVGKPFPLGAHPEAFELETAGPDIFVNLPGLHEIAVINRRTRAISRWRLTLGGNFSMALDESDRRLFVATHAPPRLAVFDISSGRFATALPCVPNVDDMFYDPLRKRIYLTGGAAYISVFQQSDAGRYQLLADVPSALGARTSGYWGKMAKGFDRFYVGVPARGSVPAEVLIYSVQD